MINYFGYGAYRNQEWFSHVLGYEVSGGQGALLNGFSLAYQLLMEIPEPVRKILREVWGEEYRCYTLKPDLRGQVIGRIWTISEEDLVKLKEWEFDSIWREHIEVKVCLNNGKVLAAVTIN